MRRLRPLVIPLALALIVGAADLGQAAPTATPALGTDGHGVRLVARGDPARLVVLLSPKRYRAVAGRRLTIMCAPVPPATLGGGAATGPRRNSRRVPRPPGGTAVRLHPPRRHTPLVTPLASGPDWCTLSHRVVLRNHIAIEGTVATVPLTTTGAAFLDERQVAVRVIGAERVVALAPPLLGFSVRRVARTLHAVVLSSPAETPPPGRLGVYGDGRRHSYAAQSDRAGALLFWETDGGETRTNLLRYKQDLSLLWGARFR